MAHHRLARRLGVAGDNRLHDGLVLFGQAGKHRRHLIHALAALLNGGVQQVEKAAQALIDAAKREADEKLSAELSRLEALKAVNPNIRDDELSAIESNRLQVLESLSQAGWRLDALRLIVVTHQ